MNNAKHEGVFEKRFIDLVKSVAAKRRQVYVDSLAKRLMGLGISGTPTKAQVNERAWTRIASLSALRTLVGGRFANLKERWLAVGFPLKEGKDEGGKLKINRSAWLELANWIEGQGFAARLPESSADGTLLEVRQLRG